jgi:hypothetical protein
MATPSLELTPAPTTSRQKPHNPPGITHERVMQLHEAGKTREEIAQILGLTEQGIAYHFLATPNRKRSTKTLKRLASAKARLQEKLNQVDTEVAEIEAEEHLRQLRLEEAKKVRLTLNDDGTLLITKFNHHLMLSVEDCRDLAQQIGLLLGEF